MLCVFELLSRLSHNYQHPPGQGVSIIMAFRIYWGTEGERVGILGYRGGVLGYRGVGAHKVVYRKDDKAIAKMFM